MSHETRTPPGLLVGAVLAVLLVMHADVVHAAVTATDLDNPGYLTTAFNRLVGMLNTAVNKALANGPYLTWARNLLIGAFVFKIFEILFKYIWGGANVADLVAVLFIGIIVTALFSTYAHWSTAIYLAGFELGRLVQGQAIGDTGIMGPVIFINKVLANVTIKDESFFSLGVTQIIMAFILLVGEAMVAGASYFAALWPSLVFAVIKLAGPVVFFSLFHERISWIFDSWLRLLFGCAFLALIARICIIVICILFQAMFDVGYSQSAGTQVIVITTENFGAFLYVVSAAVVSLALLFAASGIAAKMAMGAEIGLGKAVGQIARSIAMSVL